MRPTDNSLELADAVNRITAIHEQLAKSEVYRGYRSVPITLSGVAGLAAAALQNTFMPEYSPAGFIKYWAFAGGTCGLIAASEIAWHYVRSNSAYERRCCRTVIGQLVPCLTGAALVSIVLAAKAPAYVTLLPALWAFFFGLGIFASRPYLPRATGWLGLYFFVTGTCLLQFTDLTHAPSGWSVGGIFGIGQILAGGVLYWNIERKQS